MEEKAGVKVKEIDVFTLAIRSIGRLILLSLHEIQKVLIFN